MRIELWCDFRHHYKVTMCIQSPGLKGRLWQASPSQGCSPRLRRHSCSIMNLLTCRSFLLWHQPLRKKIPTGQLGTVSWISWAAQCSYCFLSLVFPGHTPSPLTEHSLAQLSPFPPRLSCEQGSIYHQPVPSPEVNITFHQTPQWQRIMLKFKGLAVPNISS